ncbi:hypothetical protein ACLUWG_03960 [Bifidobacterium apri]|uniref:hypothetical protein n=1 Tax=Bifidobacterium apri TaxID=1769423 RepID=UPI003992E0FA
MPADTPLTRDGSIPARFIDTVMVPSGDFIAAKVTRCMAEEHSVSCAFADKSNAGSLLLHSLMTSSFMFFDTSRDESLLPSTQRDVRCLFTDTSNEDSWLSVAYSVVSRVLCDTSNDDSWLLHASSWARFRKYSTALRLEIVLLVMEIF